MINRAEKVDCGAFVGEKLWYSRLSFSANRDQGYD